MNLSHLCRAYDISFHTRLNCCVFLLSAATCCSSLNIHTFSISQWCKDGDLESLQWCSVSLFVTNEDKRILHPLGYLVMLSQWISLIKQSDGERGVFTFMVSDGRRCSTSPAVTWCIFTKCPVLTVKMRLTAVKAAEKKSLSSVTGGRSGRWRWQDREAAFLCTLRMLVSWDESHWRGAELYKMMHLHSTSQHHRPSRARSGGPRCFHAFAAADR